MHQFTEQDMIRLIHYLLLFSVVSATPACFGSESKVAETCNKENSASIEIGSDTSIATIRGKAGIANLQQNKLEVAHDTVYLNGQSFGPLGKKCEVKFVVTRSSTILFVDDEPRVRPALK